MGNQLVGIAPSQIYPVEHYLTDYTEIKFDHRIGSTRFFKVARAESQEGLIVVKVFVIHDPTLPLQPYKDCLDELRIKLSSTANCLPFQRMILTEKAGFIMREYAKHSLYDRISTRPFLTNIEKRWITFQVLHALYQCHKIGVCHGDIKLENIMITSWNWVLLVDFASFKPTFLPEDKPADFSYFFDTSRRRVCYVAPERFIKTANSDTNLLFNEATCTSRDLKPSMDIFSAGCALLEFWNEGHTPFELSNLFRYRGNEYFPQKYIDAIDDPALKALIISMIQLDPNQRLSAELYLSQERGKLFPEYFYSFLQAYMQIFSGNPILSPDEKILRLKNDIGNMLKYLHPINDDDNDKPKETEKQDAEKPESGKKKIVRDDDGLVLITALVTSCIRGLHDCTSKLQSLDILLELASHASEEIILDRILPYIMYLAHDVNARVKVSAIHMITQCMNLVKRIPRSDANIFPEYILPGLASLVIDSNTSVRAAYAQNIATLAETALRFLEQTQTDWCDNSGKNKDLPRINYEIELQTLHEMVQQSVSALLTDNQTLVKQTLMESGITKLCVFFGKQKANDVLLSHMITFLNDKEDKELRGSFFDCIVGVSAYIGCHCSIILTPLLLQGLTDCSEFVTTKSINAMSSLTELGLLSKPALCELVSECSCFLVHPSLWVRQAVAGFVAMAAKSLSVLDVQCKIIPLLSIYMKYPLIQINRSELLLESLVNPIPRIVYDNVIKYSDINILLDTLKERQEARLVASLGRIPNYGEMRHTLKGLFRRLVADGMTDAVEDYLLMMSSHLKKIHKHKTSADAIHNKQSEGKIEITTPIRTHVCNLSEARNKVDLHSRKPRRIQPASPMDANSNSDWNVIGAEVIPRPSEIGPSSRPNTPPGDGAFADHAVNISLHERSYIQYRTANCSVELRKLISRQQDHYLEALRSKEWAEQAAWQPQLPPPGWKLRGSLVAHLHEHHGQITKLAPLPETSLFASASKDGFVRIWDCAKMEGKNIANRSKQFYKVAGGIGVSGLAVCENGQSLAAATQDGSILVLRVEPTSSRMTLVQARELNKDEDGCATDVQYLDSGAQSVLVYSTLYGNLVGWDLRAPGTAWKLENTMKYGFITSFCLDSHQSWVTLGTNRGYHVAWDLRFRLPITTIEHPTRSTRIRKVISHPTEHSWIISSVEGNNEISMWNLETGFRQTTLWGSTTPPFSKSQGNNQVANAMLAGCIDRSGFLLAGGTDQRIRFWDLENPTESYLAIPAPNEQPVPINYEHRLIDGTSVIYTVTQPTQNTKMPGKGDEIPRAGPEAPSSGHRDCISDIALCKASQCFLLTASRDGVIKVWK